MVAKSTIEPMTLIAGRYEVQNLIGQGGMSSVYFVRDIRLNTNWAMKVLLNSEKHAEVRQLLKGELDMLTRLSHPSLPRIVDVIDTEGSLCVIMDYIEGQSLGDIVERGGPQPVEKVYEWAIQLCDVLHYLHTLSHPIIYRDMKPQNIILRPNGSISLIDFGTAREYNTDDLGDTMWLGTKGYAAPEQFGGRGQTDQRTDIYGLGVTMHTLLTGLTPSQTEYTILPVSTYRPELKGSAIEAIIAKCCATEREERFQSCEELAIALKNKKISKSHIGIQKKGKSGLLFNIGRTIDSIKQFRESESKDIQTTKYQVFISFKHTDDFGRETADSVLAENLYKKLRAKRIKVFFSKESILAEASDKYKNSISHALQESRILVVVGTRPDYMNSPWVRREFQEFRGKMKNSKNANDFAVFNYLGPDMHVNSLPVELKDYTSYTDAEKLKGVILSRLTGSGKQEEMPSELRAGAVWEQYRPGVIINKRYQLYKCIKPESVKLYTHLPFRILGFISRIQVFAVY